MVKSNPDPLCSDALTGWIANDLQYRIHNKGNCSSQLGVVSDNKIPEVQDATARLLHIIIPKFARWLDDSMMDTKKNRVVLAGIIEDLHRRGINVRHLG